MILTHKRKGECLTAVSLTEYNKSYLRRTEGYGAARSDDPAEALNAHGVRIGNGGRS